MKTRVSATPTAQALLEELRQEYGPLMLYQAGGCCEGTQPQCFKKGAFFPRKNDALIGELDGIPFWIDKDLFEYWKFAHFELDVIDGFGAGGFSLETPKNKTFKVNYTLFSEDDFNELAEVPRYGVNYDPQ